MATQMKLPDHLAELASNFKESSCGACRVTLVLDNQKTVKRNNRKTIGQALPINTKPVFDKNAGFVRCGLKRIQEMIIISKNPLFRRTDPDL